ncbi:MBL fold metallo-hydrolase [Virgibacillus sp. NKC19-3]|uniref:MBL fold metallo-hydrolase n=1 Tax=Virgibacillus saliphilus TaxID=2831674 RepID=UPI001C9A878E|nr:MBL fold metallo-hydrolase [Virgibacillus sp. NKC19-3]MBY7142826.1 MBL fold metallo-hydrolase [Virgibacillus sp. NKC19-3]
MSHNRIYRSGKSLINQLEKTQAPVNGIVLWHLGQSGVVLKSEHGMCYFDPYLSNYIEDNNLVEPGLLERSYDPPIQPDDISNADIVFITHDHLDHLDPETLAGIAKHSPQVKFICPAPSILKLKEVGIKEESIYAAKAIEKLVVNGIEVTPIPAKHEDYLIDKNGDHYYLGYILNINGVTFYHAGDTIVFNELIEYLYPFSIAIAYLPINGRDWRRSEQGVLGNMDFRDAVELSQAVGIDLIVPAHYDLFESNTENPAYFVDYIYQNYPGQKFKLMVPGERMVYLSEV